MSGMEKARQNGQGVPGTVTVKINPEKVKALLHADQSIQHWSVKHMSLSLELRGVEATVHGLQEHKSQIMSDALKEVGIDMRRFSSARMSGDGTVLLTPDPAFVPPGPAEQEGEQQASQEQESEQPVQSGHLPD